MVWARRPAISDGKHAPRNEPSAAKLDAIFLSLWRQALDEGSGLELTLTEAAALFGTTTQTLRRRIERDEIQTRRDSRGRLRVIPLLGTSAELAEATSGDAQATVVRLFEELKRVRQDLATAQSQRDALEQELANAREALTGLRVSWLRGRMWVCRAGRWAIPMTWNRSATSVCGWRRSSTRRVSWRAVVAGGD